MGGQAGQAPVGLPAVSVFPAVQVVRNTASLLGLLDRRDCQLLLALTLPFLGSCKATQG